MKPGRNDVQLPVLIAGAQLDELKKHTYLMAESSGLDRRVERYRGTRPLGLYRWDLECLLDVLDLALADRSEYPSQDAPGYQALDALRRRVRAAYEAHVHAERGGAKDRVVDSRADGGTRGAGRAR